MTRTFIATCTLGAMLCGSALSCGLNREPGDDGDDETNPGVTGVLDAAFGTGGIVTTDVGGGSGYALAIQADGKIVVAGYGANFEFAVARYNPDGSLDAGFNGDGKLSTPVGSGTSGVQAVAIQADGRIVVAGSTYFGGYFDFAVVRYNPDGSLDSGFDGDGKAITAVSNGSDLAQALAIQANGKIVVAGWANTGTHNDFALVRYNTDGSLDTGFDGDGKATIAVGSGEAFARGVAIQADGKIVAAGSAYNGSTYDFALVRCNSDGSLDSGFDGDGKLTTAVGSGDDHAYGLAIQADGKIVAAGWANNGANFDFALVRYTAYGSLDPSFDGDGRVTTSAGSGQDWAYGLAIQADGKIVAAGSNEFGGTTFTVVRYTSNGSLDSAFGAGGILTTAVGSGGSSCGRALAIQADGKIVVAGDAYDGVTDSDFAVVRYK